MKKRMKKMGTLLLTAALLVTVIPVNAQEIKEPQKNEEVSESTKEDVPVDGDTSKGDEQKQEDVTDGDNEDVSGDVENTEKEPVSEEVTSSIDMSQEETETTEDVFATMEEVEVATGWYTINVFNSSTLCLDVVGGSEKTGAEIQLYKSNNTLAQKFYIKKEDNGWYTIRNVSSNLALGVSEHNLSEGQKLQQWTITSGAEQQVKIYKNHEGALVFKVNAEDNLVYAISGRAVSGSRLNLSMYDEKQIQGFTIKSCVMPGEQSEIEEGIYRIYPASAREVSLDVAGGSVGKGANIQLYTKNGTAAQEWKIVKQGSWYKIVSAKSSMVLDVKGGSSNPRANLQQYTNNAGLGQLYRFYKVDENQYCMMSKLGTVVDCTSGSTKRGTNVQMYTANKTAAQRWGVEKILVPAATEKSIEDGYYTISNGSNTELKMSVADASKDSGANIEVKNATGTDEQVFKLEKQSDGWYMLKNQMSGKYLDIQSGNASPGANLQQYGKNSTNAQKFKLYDAGQGKYYIRSKLFTFVEALAEENGNIQMNIAQCTEQQKWEFNQIIPESTAVNITNGDYILSSGLGNNLVLDVQSGSKASGGNIQVYTTNGSMAQNFYIHKESDGWYTIQNNCSKKYLDVAAGSNQPGANLQQYTGNGTDAQKFKFYDTGTGKLFVKSKLGTIIDVDGARKVAGTNVKMYSFNGSNAQKWTLKKSPRVPMNEWVYKNGYKLYYNASGALVKDVSYLIGKQSSYVIKVNKQRNVVTVYAKDGANGYIIPVKSFVCSTGAATPSGTFYTPNKYRWWTLMGPSYGQWCTRINGGVLFHSVFYNSFNNNNALSVSAYNKLGTTCSHGCVRLKAGDAKWIYDNCSLKTKVIIYSSSDVGPFGKPGSYKLPSWHTWDPTDPNMVKKCKAKGCH